jgi:hypothetical protein
MMTSRSLICLLENQNGGKLQKNVIEKSFMNWRVLSPVKINTRLSDTLCIIRRR